MNRTNLTAERAAWRELASSLHHADVTPARKLADEIRAELDALFPRADESDPEYVERRAVEHSLERGHLAGDRAAARRRLHDPADQRPPWRGTGPGRSE